MMFYMEYLRLANSMYGNKFVYFANWRKGTVWEVVGVLNQDWKSILNFC